MQIKLILPILITLALPLACKSNTIDVSELPEDYLCMIFNTVFKSDQKSTSTEYDSQYYIVNGDNWRLETIKEDKGFVITSDGKTIFSGDPKISKKVESRIESFHPKYVLKEFLSDFKSSRIIESKSVCIEAIDCTYYKIEGDEVIELWILKDKLLPFRLVMQLSDNEILQQEYTWLTMLPTEDLILIDDHTYQWFTNYANAINRKLNEN